MTATALDSFFPKDTASLHIKGPDGEDTGWKIEFAGPSHEKTKEWQDSVLRKELRRSEQIQQSRINGKNYKVEHRSPDDVKRENIEFVTARIVGWNTISVGGVEYQFSQSTANELFMKPEFGFAFGQCVEFLADQSSFTKDSAKS